MALLILSENKKRNVKEITNELAGKPVTNEGEESQKYEVLF